MVMDVLRKMLRMGSIRSSIRNRRISGYLTREDLRTLEDASRRKPKYAKKFTQSFECGGCNYKWFYESSRCPVCESFQFRKA